MMPFGGATEFQQTQVVTAQEMRDKIEPKLGPLDAGRRRQAGRRSAPLPPGRRPGDVGFICSVTEPFCASCTRARLTADGKLRLCLLRDKEVDLLTPLRAGASLDDLRASSPRPSSTSPGATAWPTTWSR